MAEVVRAIKIECIRNTIGGEAELVFRPRNVRPVRVSPAFLEANKVSDGCWWVVDSEGGVRVEPPVAWEDNGTGLLEFGPKLRGGEKERMLQWFTFDHLPVALQPTSRAFSVLASEIVATIVPGPERTVALRKLLESKDACVRAKLTAGG